MKRSVVALLVALLAVMGVNIAAAPVAYAQAEIGPGDAILVPGGRCTLGFVLTAPDGLSEGITAGHCGNVGDDVRNKDGSRVIGTITASDGATGAGLLNPNKTDLARIKFHGNPKGSLSTWVPFDGKYYPVLGLLSAQEVNQSRPVLCKYGSSTQQTCGAVKAVQDNHALVEAKTEPGDSGAPVYAKTDDGVYLVGIVSGGYEGLGDYSAQLLADRAKEWNLAVTSPER